jgi:putative ABC transport system permease protein
MWTDLRIAVRRLQARLLIAIPSAAVLAIGIIVSAAAFAIVDAFLFQRLPVRRPDQVIVVGRSPSPGLQAGEPGPIGAAAFAGLRTHPMLESVAAIEQGALASSERNSAGWYEGVVATAVTASFFQVLDVRPVIGRAFLPSDDRSDTTAILISHDLWLGRFGGDGRIVGHLVSIADRPALVLGVLPPAFDFPHGTNVWVALPTPDPSEREFESLLAVARLREGRSAPGFNQLQRTLYAVSLPAYARPQGWTRLALLFCAALLTLTMAVLHAGGLELSKWSGRRVEVGTQIALGAPPWRIVRQATMEIGLLVGIAAVAAGLFSTASIAALLSVLPFVVSRGHYVVLRPGFIVLAGAVAAAVMLLLVGGSIGRWCRLPPAEVFGARARSMVGTGNRFRHLLLAFQLAVTTVLLYFAATMVQSVRHLGGADLGFVPDGLYALSIDRNPNEWLEALRSNPVVGGTRGGRHRADSGALEFCQRGLFLDRRNARRCRTRVPRSGHGSDGVRRGRECLAGAETVFATGCGARGSRRAASPRRRLSSPHRRCRRRYGCAPSG